MSKIVVPIQGENVISETQPEPQAAEQPERSSAFKDGIFRPATATRNELSRHMSENALGRTIARSMERRAEASAPAPSQPSQMEAMSQQVSAMQAAVDRMVGQTFGRAPDRQQGGGHDNQDYRYGGDQPGSDSQDYGGAPDPNDFDLWDDVGRVQYRHALESHVKEVAARAVESDRTARQLASDEERYRADIAATKARFGRDANFEEIQAQAAQIVIATGGKVLLEEAYKAVSDDVEARSNRRGTSYMPAEIRKAGLSAIMRYNQETGRAGKRRR